MSFADTKSINSRREKFTFIRKSTKSSGKDFLLIGLDFDMNLFMLASQVCAIRFSASALTPAEITPRQWLVKANLRDYDKLCAFTQFLMLKHAHILNI
jgi:hypothetical protein